MNNKKNEMTKLVDDLFVELKNLNFNVFLQDERLSSESAKKIMREQNIKTGNNCNLNTCSRIKSYPVSYYHITYETC